MNKTENILYGPDNEINHFMVQQSLITVEKLKEDKKVSFKVILTVYKEETEDDNSIELLLNTFDNIDTAVEFADGTKQVGVILALQKEKIDLSVLESAECCAVNVLINIDDGKRSNDYIIYSKNIYFA